MSLTSYRAAPPRGMVGGLRGRRAWGRARRGRAWLWLAGSGSGRPGGDLLSRGLSRSTIGAEGFHGRVRDGIGCLPPRHGHQAVGSQSPSGPAVRRRARAVPLSGPPGRERARRQGGRPGPARDASAAAHGRDQANRAISTGPLNASLRLHARPIDVMVCHGSQRDLVLRWVSRLDAFSGYPVRT